MFKLKEKILKQHNIGQSWGRFALAASQIAMFVSVLTLCMVTINAYVPVSVWLVKHGIQLQFWMFVSIIIVPIMVAYFLAWKFLVPSFYRSSTEQFWKQSEITQKFDKLDNIEKILGDELPEIKKRLAGLEEKWK